MLTLYTKNNCMGCKMLKQKLQKDGFDYHEINVNEDLAAMNYLMSCNLRTLPVLFKDDELICLGFQPQNLGKLL